MTADFSPSPVPNDEMALAPGNRLLAGLPPRDLALLAPHLRRVVLERGQVLLQPGDLVPYVFFPELGTLIGLFTATTGGQHIKVARVDRQRALGLIEAVDDGQSLNRATTVMPGPALRISAAAFAAAARRSASIRHAVTRHCEMLLGEAMQNAACNAVHSAEQRVARWLLAVHDVVHDEASPDADAAALPITQERLGDMLGLQRTTITAVARRFQAAGLTRYRRGHISLVDRPGIERLACDCNQAVAALQHRLMQRQHRGG